MRLLFLVLSLVAFAAALINNENPLETAKKIQAQLDEYARQRYRTGIMTMLLNSFYYQDCKGNIFNSSEPRRLP
uniref:Uncharacterized protein n=1 Tax=Caenorhabditis tropicalis TaxID=1561998 RepID=A0A1I7UJE0_9PELO